MVSSHNTFFLDYQIKIIKYSGVYSSILLNYEDNKDTSIMRNYSYTGNKQFDSQNSVRHCIQSYNCFKEWKKFNWKVWSHTEQICDLKFYTRFNYHFRVSILYRNTAYTYSEYRYGIEILTTTEIWSFHSPNKDILSRDSSKFHPTSHISFIPEKKLT